MKILCINFKGGVGKSTTAVHITGVMSGIGNTLLVDGDRQVNSYSFFLRGDLPQTDKVVEISNSLSVITLNSLSPTSRHALSQRISKIGKLKFEHLVFDTTPDAFSAAQIISEIEPDIILVPVKYGDEGGLIQLRHVFNSIQALIATGLNPVVKIVPIGIDEGSIIPFLPAVTFSFSFTDLIPADPLVFGMAMFRDFEYIWTYAGYEYLYDVYYNMIFGK
ncbi:chromosome partitioning protein [Massilia sp. UYP32]|uniref:ParA family protein n=1 Tax=Massilia sp. UYP32 TaxID=1756386 RepID=UPI003D20C64E